MKKEKRATFNLQVSVDSLREGPVLNLESPAPFQAIHIGDTISLQKPDAEHWFPDADPPPRIAYVVAKTHYFTDDDDHVIHTVHLAVSLTPKK